MPEKDPIVLKYRPNRPGEGFPGVPQRDLTQRDIDALSGDERRHVLVPQVNPLYVPVEEVKLASTARPKSPKKPKTAKPTLVETTNPDASLDAGKTEPSDDGDGETKDGDA
jgi:hypothetical protein